MIPETERNVVKLLDARAINGRFWVFFGALSNVKFALSIQDTGVPRRPTKTYFNQLGTFASRGDTDAFPLEIP